MIPEGLQYQSVANIVAKLTEAGVNVIRLTYAIELIDQIYENGGVDVPISTAFAEALGDTDGAAVFQEVLKANPSFSENITRLEVSGKCTTRYTLPCFCVLLIFSLSRSRSYSLVTEIRFVLGRCSMPLLQSARPMKFTSISTITFPKELGAAAQTTVMRGGETLISPSQIGQEVSHIWPTT